MHIIRDLLPERVRLGIYSLYALAGLVVGSIEVYVGSGVLDWTDGAVRVLAYLAVPMAILAGTNVPDSDFEGEIDAPGFSGGPGA